MKKFTQNWFNPAWMKHFQAKDLPIKKYLEIGSFEGRSLCWMMENVLTGDEDIAYAIDTFEGGQEHGSLNMSLVEENFLHNIEEYKEKIKICKGMSFDELVKLYPDKAEYFDFIYIDGSHDSWDVITDATVSFKLLKKGGIMGFDDYQWMVHWGPRSPKEAIDAFLYTHQNQIKVLEKSGQVWIEKL